MKFLNDKIIDGIELTDAENYNSEPVDFTTIFLADLVATITEEVSTIGGLIKLQKNDEPHTTNDAVFEAGWHDLDDTEVITGTNSQAYTGAGKFSWALKDIGYKWLRGVVQNTTGTVGVNLRINAKGY